MPQVTAALVVADVRPAALVDVAADDEEVAVGLPPLPLHHCVQEARDLRLVLRGGPLPQQVIADLLYIDIPFRVPPSPKAT